MKISAKTKTVLSLLFCRANMVRLSALVLLWPLGLIARLIPKKNNRVIIGARYGKFYDWGPMYLFEHILANRDKHGYEVYWVARTNELYEELKAQGKPVLKLYRPADVWKVLRARVAVYSTSPGDIDLHLIAGATQINTYHGIPIRKVAHDYLNWRSTKIPTSQGRAIHKVLMTVYHFFRVEDKGDYIITSSEAMNDIWHSQYAHKRERYRILGLPRNDGLFIDEDLQIKRNPDERIICYLPTRRGEPGLTNHTIADLFTRYNFDADAMDSMLEKHNARLLLKCHHRQLGNDSLAKVVADSKRTFFYEGQDVIPVLRESDILITDYSSVVWHYLLLNRPVVFACFDLEEYGEEMGFTLDYREFMPGPLCSDWASVTHHLEALLEGKDTWIEQRAECTRTVHKYTDSNNCERLASFIGSLVNGENV